MLHVLPPPSNLSNATNQVVNKFEIKSMFCEFVDRCLLLLQVWLYKRALQLGRFSDWNHLFTERHHGSGVLPALVFEKNFGSI